MKQIFVDGSYDYDYVTENVDNGVVHILLRSEGEQWSGDAKGEEVVSITDTGNGFTFNHSRPKKEMDYSEAFELSIILKIISFNESIVEISKKELL